MALFFGLKIALFLTHKKGCKLHINQTSKINFKKVIWTKIINLVKKITTNNIE